MGLFIRLKISDSSTGKPFLNIQKAKELRLFRFLFPRLLLSRGFYILQKNFEKFLKKVYPFFQLICHNIREHKQSNSEVHYERYHGIGKNGGKRRQSGI